MKLLARTLPSRHRRLLAAVPLLLCATVSSGTQPVREPAVAGSCFSADPAVLQKEINLKTALGH